MTVETTAAATLELGWVASQGAVRFTVYNVPDDGRTTVKRVNPGGSLTAIRGYPDGKWHSTTGLGYDYEAPMSVLVSYAIVDRDATVLSQATVLTPQATNLAVNPALEGGVITGWNSNSTAAYPVTMDNTAPVAGVWSVLSTRTASSPNNGVASLYLQPAGGTAGFPCTPGNPITVSLAVKHEQANRRVQIYYQWLDGAGTIVSSESAGYVLNDTGPGGTIQRVAHTGLPPTGAVTARVIITTLTPTGNAITGERVWFDQLRVSGGPATLDATNQAVNPSLGGGTLTGWASVSSTAYLLTLDATSAMSGVYSALLTRADVNPSGIAGALSQTNPNGANSNYAVTAGVPVTASLDVKPELAGRRIRSWFQWFDAGNVATNSAIVVHQDPTVAGQTYRISQTDTPPVGTVGMRFRVEVSLATGNATTGERVWFDQVAIGSTAIPPFDGNTQPDGTYVYTWAGVPYSSASQRWLVSGGEQTDTAYFDGDTAAAGSYSYKWTGTAKASTSQKLLAVTAWPPSGQIFTETPGRINGEAWLRDVMQPALSRPVSVVSTGDEVYVARQTILDVAGKSTPYAVWDSRQARQGTVQLMVWNTPIPGVWNDSTPRAKLEALFSTGRPLLLSLCANKGFRNAYLAVDSVTFTRVGLGPAWLVDLAYFEVDNPTGLQVQITPEVTYATAQQLPPSAAYSDWSTVNYISIATRTSV